MDSHPAPANAVVNTMDLDLDLAERINNALSALDVLRGARARVDVTVANGQVTLNGNVQSPMSAVEVERAAAAVAGGAPVTNRLTDDATLSRLVAETLSTDPRTSAIPPGYEVASTYGHISLVGYFTPEQSAAVVAVSQAVPAVRNVNVRAL